jgi:hypothetical protein
MNKIASIYDLYSLDPVYSPSIWIVWRFLDLFGSVSRSEVKNHGYMVKIKLNLVFILIISGSNSTDSGGTEWNIAWCSGYCTNEINL